MGNIKSVCVCVEEQSFMYEFVIEDQQQISGENTADRVISVCLFLSD